MTTEYKKNPHGFYALYTSDGGETWKESAHLANDSIVSDESVQPVEEIDKGAKYMVTIRDRTTGNTIEGDVYDVLEAYKITCPSMSHAIKKLLLAGKRGAKGFDKDCDEGINSIEQSKLLEKWR